MHIVLIYIAILVGIFFEGELILISSIIAAHNGYLNFWLVMVLGILATYCADLFYFFLGRKKGKQWLEKRKKLKSRAQIIDNKLKKYPIFFFFSYRFMYGLRTITPIVIGLGSINTRKFLMLSALGTFIWGVFFGIIGYLFGDIVKSKMGHIEHIEKYIIGILLLVGIIVLIIRRLIYKKQIWEKPDEPMTA